MKKRLYGLIITFAAAGMTGAGCSRPADPVSEDIVIEKERDVTEYVLAEARKDDVYRTAKIKCSCRQTNEESFYFDQSGLTVDKVYVKKGDKVEAGQVLAEIAGTDREEAILDLQYRISRNRLLLEQSVENENLEQTELYNQYYNGWMDEPGYVKEYLRLQQNWRYRREDWQDAIELDEQQLALWEQEDTDRKLYAGRGGVILFVKENLEGSVTNRDEIAVTIADSTDCLMISSQIEYKDYFTPDTGIVMKISRGTGAGEYEMIPFEPESWEDQMIFSFGELAETLEIPAGTEGMIEFPLDKKEQVLSVPKEVIHHADHRAYVYVINDYGVRTVQWIETGLEGDSRTEVLSGLEEGDKVIVK